VNLPLNLLRLTALVLTALILIPSGAHLFSLAVKMNLPRPDYFTVQAIYAGWSLFSAPIFAAIVANAGLFLALRHTRATQARWALVSALLILASLAVFFIWIFPGNRATANWTASPANWEALRQSWEYGHAANALLIFAAFVATVWAALPSTTRPT
jgi:hypothetical protein